MQICKYELVKRLMYLAFISRTHYDTQ